MRNESESWWADWAMRMSDPTLADGIGEALKKKDEEIAKEEKNKAIIEASQRKRGK